MSSQTVDVPSASAAPDSATAAEIRAVLAGKPRRILICRPNGRLGNALLLTPLVQELEQQFPGAEIDILSACPAAFEVFSEYKSVQNVFVLPRLGVRRPHRVLGKFFSLRTTKYDLIIDPCPRSWSSRFWTRHMDARAVKLGFRSQKKNSGVNFSVPFDSAPSHMAHYPVYLLRQAMNQNSEQRHSRIPELAIRLTDDERAFGAQKVQELIRNFDPHSPVLGVYLTATDTKRLSVPYWRRLIDRLKLEMPGVQIIEIIAANRQAYAPEYPGYFSMNIRRIAAVMNGMDWLISGDCGLMHLSAATDVPTIGLFVDSSPSLFGPYGKSNLSIEVEEKNPQPSIERIANEIVSLAARRTTRVQFPVQRPRRLETEESERLPLRDRHV